MMHSQCVKAPVHVTAQSLAGKKPQDAFGVELTVMQHRSYCQ